MTEQLVELGRNVQSKLAGISEGVAPYVKRALTEASKFAAIVLEQQTEIAGKVKKALTEASGVQFGDYVTDRQLAIGVLGLCALTCLWVAYRTFCYCCCGTKQKVVDVVEEKPKQVQPEKKPLSKKQRR